VETDVTPTTVATKDTREVLSTLRIRPEPAPPGVRLDLAPRARFMIAS
jgi:hypothetical protein